jgi:hypothetical protein
MSLLRAGLLKGRRIAVAATVGEELRQVLTRLGAEVEVLQTEDIPSEEERVGDWARAHGPLDAFVYCAASAFGAGGEPGLLGALDEAWAALREVAVGALIDRDGPGKLVVLAPPRDAGPLAEATRAGLENLVRTLSVEWARYGVTSVLVAPSAGTEESELATLVGFLVSEAGAYLSGCRLDLGTAS